MAISISSTDNRALLEERYRQFFEDADMAGANGVFDKFIGIDSPEPQAGFPASDLASERGLSEFPDNPVNIFNGPTSVQYPIQGMVGQDPQALNQSGQGRGGDSASESVNMLREQADGLRARADDLREQADVVVVENPQLAQSMRNHATALDQRADAVDMRADTVVERMAIAEEDALLNGGTDNGSDQVGPGFSPDNSDFVSVWLDERELKTLMVGLEGALGSIDEFGGDIDVTAAREANEAEVDLFLDRAELNGATTEDLELIEGYTDAFPIQFVFVDNLISDYGIEAAAGGEVTIQGTTTILLDDSFRDVDFTRLSTLEDPGIAAQATEAVEFAYDSILEIFDLPGQTNTGIADTSAATSTVTPLGENDDAAIVATPVVSTTSAVPTVESTDEDDEASADANAAVSGAGDFDSDE